MTLHKAERNGPRFLNPVPTSVGGLSIMFKVGPSFFLDTAARSPKVAPGPFRTDPAVYAMSCQIGFARYLVRALLFAGGD